MENRIIKLENNLGAEIRDLNEHHLTDTIGVVAEYLWDKFTNTHGASDELSQNTIEIIEPYCTKVSSENSEYDMYLLPYEQDGEMDMLSELQGYFDEFGLLSKDEQENAEGDNWDLMCIARDYETINSYIEQVDISMDLVIIHKR